MRASEVLNAERFYDFDGKRYVVPLEVALETVAQLEAELRATKISKAEHDRYREALKLVTHAIDKETAVDFARKALRGE